MEKYRDIDGDSGIRSFLLGDDFIEVEFSTGKIYTYTYASGGSYHIEKMKDLATRGDGLNAYINNNDVRYSYSR